MHGVVFFCGILTAVLQDDVRATRMLVKEVGHIVGAAGYDHPAGGAVGVFGDFETTEEAGRFFNV